MPELYADMSRDSACELQQTVPVATPDEHFLVAELFRAFLSERVGTDFHVRLRRPVLEKPSPETCVWPRGRNFTEPKIGLLLPKHLRSTHNGFNGSYLCVWSCAWQGAEGQL